MRPLTLKSRPRWAGVWRGRGREATFAILAAAASLSAAEADAQDRFEIQVYDAEVAPAGEPGLELHANAVTRGSPQPAGPELPTQGVVHLTLEPHLGLSSWCEVGGYLQTAQRPEGQLDAAGVKLRLKARLPRRYSGFGFAANLEVSDVPRRYEANQYGAELRPIADYKAVRWYAAVNPIVGVDLAGDQALRPQFEPAAKLAYSLEAPLSVGAEYYGAFGAAPAQLAYAVLDFTSRWIDLEAGVGYGFAGPERWVLKAILGVHPPAR